MTPRGQATEKEKGKDGNTPDMRNIIELSYDIM
jgi:hypothetical protein